MGDESKIVRNRLNVYVPFSVMEVIKRTVEMRICDGRTNVSNQSVALELMDIGARVQTKKLDAMERGESLHQNKLEEQLSFIAHNVVRANQKVERLIKIYGEHQNVERELLVRIIEHTPLKDREVSYLKSLFAGLENYDYE
ncbi:relaxosome protein TraM [Ursidibacter arcticus]